MNLQRPRFPGGATLMNPRRFRVRIPTGGFFGQTEDPSTVVDENQIRQSTFDPSMSPLDPAAGDPLATDPLKTITVTGHPPAPIWPLLIVLAVAGYLWWGGRD
jgi:hypothetical protein